MLSIKRKPPIFDLSLSRITQGQKWVKKGIFQNIRILLACLMCCFLGMFRHKKSGISEDMPLLNK